MHLIMPLSGDSWRVTGWYTKQWRMHTSMEMNIGIPPAIPAIPAIVPGSIPIDLLRAGWIKDPNFGLHSMDMEWVNNRDWVMERRFEVSSDWIQDRSELVFEGLDYSGEIFLNRERIAKFEGMFQPLTLDVTQRLNTGPGTENVLQVVFFTAPYVDGQIGHSHTIRKIKSRFNYGWDWCPRMIAVGIWRDVSLRTFSRVKLADFFPEASLDEDLARGRLNLHLGVEVLQPGSYQACYRLIDSQGSDQWEKTFEMSLAGGVQEIRHESAVGPVKLWWPNGLGEHPTYDVEVVLLDKEGSVCDRAVRSVGFRRLSWEKNPGAPQASLPYTLQVNGRRVFIKGVNWVPLSPFLGSIRAEQYDAYLGRFSAMQANLVRVWGGAIHESQQFYATCDRLGILVWQEFLQSSSGLTNSPPDNPEFLEQLEAVSRTGVIQLRSHPSLAVWCGGNELMWEGYRPVDEGHLNIKRLQALVRELDGDRQFFPASPSGPRFNVSMEDIGRGLHHDVHGPWDYSGDGTHYGLFNQDDAQFRSETGTPGAAREQALRGYADGLPVWPPTKANPYWVHRGAWWIAWEKMSDLFGPWREDVDETGKFLQASRYLQMESLRYAVEATRRREPEASGIIIWMGNEPFPNAINTSLLEYDGTPKPAYETVKRAFSARHVSARYGKIAYRQGERFDGRIFVHDESRSLEIGWVHAAIVDAHGKVLMQERFEVDRRGPVQEVGSVAWDVRTCPYDVFLLRVEWLNAHFEVMSRNDYLFSVDAEHPLEPLRRLPSAQVTISSKQGRKEWVEVHNSSSVLAVGVFLYGKDASQFLAMDPNGLMLLPDERATIHCSTPVRPQDIHIEWFNS